MEGKVAFAQPESDCDINFWSDYSSQYGSVPKKLSVPVK